MGPEADLRSSTASGPFREALSYWASGVAVLAASDGDEIDAITVSAFTALSADPPLVLANVGEQTSVLLMILEERRFTISILSAEQRSIASAVAERYPGIASFFRSPADPSIPGAVAALTCTIWADHPGGDHRIIVGAVDAITYGASTSPLLYFRREYRGFE